MKYRFELPSEDKVLKRNRAITTYYAQLYQMEPQLYKWAGMAAFASFHIGEKMKMLDWDTLGIKPLSAICKSNHRLLEDDFQIIRIINDKIFADIGWIHLAFCQEDFSSFKALLLQNNGHQTIISAFEKLNTARGKLNRDGASESTNKLIWEANHDILWHEQSEVVQPLFDRLSGLFSHAMTFCASFDYQVNCRITNWKTHSRFIIFMFFKGFDMIKKTWLLPEVTNLQHRWHWISNDLLKTWKMAENRNRDISVKIKELAALSA